MRTFNSAFTATWGESNTNTQKRGEKPVKEQEINLTSDQMFEVQLLMREVTTKYKIELVEKHRNEYANHLAILCKEAGLPEAATAEYVATEIENRSGYEAWETKAVFRSVYGSSNIEAPITALPDWDISKYELTSWQELPPIEYLLQNEGVGFLSRGNIAFVSGRQKVGKTFLITLLVTEYLERCPDAKVVWIDTEQSKQHVQMIIVRLERMTKKGAVRFFPLREYNKKLRTELFEAICKQTKPDLVILDGIIDLCDNPMDMASSQEAIQLLMTLSERLNCGILSVLHTNKGDTIEMRGHIGTEAGNKGETTLYLVREKCADATKVEFKTCRGLKPEDFTFEVEDGLPKRCIIQTKVRQENHWAIFASICEEGETYRYSELTKKLQAKGEEQVNAKSIIRRATASGVLTKIEAGLYKFGIDDL